MAQPGIEQDLDCLRASGGCVHDRRVCGDLRPRAPSESVLRALQADFLHCSRHDRLFHPTTSPGIRPLTVHARGGCPRDRRQHRQAGEAGRPAPVSSRATDDRSRVSIRPASLSDCLMARWLACSAREGL